MLVAHKNSCVFVSISAGNAYDILILRLISGKSKL